MAAPMTAASPTRSSAILAKENAIKAKLNKYNVANKKSATAQATKKLKPWLKGKKAHTSTAFYNTQSIKGADKGFTKSDYGVGAGAAIPYQIGTDRQVAKVTHNPNPKPKPTTKTRVVAIDNRLKNLDKTKVKGL